MINIPNDLRKNKDKIIGNMDLRECICVFLGVILAIAFLYYFRIVLQYKRVVILAFFAGLIVIPFLFFGFKRINGMKVDSYIKVFINNNILSRPVRINRYSLADDTVKEKKYELVRYYKLDDKNEMIKLRQFLFDKNILYLTEYVSYKNESYVIFRINCKDMELLQEKRNKESIEIKNNEIKDINKKLLKSNLVIKKLQIKIKRDKILKKTNEEDANKLNTIINEKKELKSKLNELKSISKTLKSKRIDTFKNEIDIFENYGIHKAQRFDDIKLLKENIVNDERNIYEVNIFNKQELKEIMGNGDRIIFISNDGKANIFIYENDVFVNKIKDHICDLISIDKKQGIYDSIKILEVRNLYNFYRKVNSLEEIL